MRIGRTLPPAATPLTLSDLMNGCRAEIAGPSTVSTFQRELEAGFQVRYCFLVSSGKAALWLILSALKKLHPERNEVLVTALTCFSVPAVIRRTGLKILLCDIDEQTLDFDYRLLPEKLERPQLLCVIVTHLFGRPAEVQRLKSLLAEKTIPVIEDAAQAFAAEAQGQQLGTLGDLGFFSLGRGKALSTLAGGVVLTNRPDLAAQLKSFEEQLATFSPLARVKMAVVALVLAVLQRPSLFWLPKLLPWLKLGETLYEPEFELKKFTPFQAGLARNWRHKITEFKRLRRANAQIWTALLDRLGQFHYGRHRGQIPDLIRFPFRLASPELRQQLLAESLLRGFGIAATYPSTIDAIPELSGQFVGEKYPVAERVVRSLVTLPIHPYLKPGDIDAIRACLHQIFKSNGQQRILKEDSL